MAGSADLVFNFFIPGGGISRKKLTPLRRTTNTGAEFRLVHSLFDSVRYGSALPEAMLLAIAATSYRVGVPTGRRLRAGGQVLSLPSP